MSIEDDKETRLVARPSKEIKDIIQLAADTLGISLSAFVIEASLERAKVVIEQHHNLKLTIAGTEALFKALDNPPDINERLKAAALNYKKHVNVNRMGETENVENKQ